MYMRRIIKKPDEKNISLKKVVADTSAIISGNLTRLIEQGKMKNSEIIIPEIVMGELQAQTSRMKESGFLGLAEIKKIRELSKKNKITIKFVGERPSYEDILLSKSGRVDALIQDIAKQNKAVLITCDLPQALVAEAEGIDVKYFESYEKKLELKIEKYLTKDTLSVHLKDKAIPLAKRGKPGKIQLVKLKDTPSTLEELEEISKEIFEAARFEDNSFLEIGERNASVIQLKDMRIAIARPPFSDGLEITVVRPIIKLNLDDYKLSNKLKERIETKVEGMLIAGPPGSGKSTLAASIAEFLMNRSNAIVKTMESPRDLQLPPEITQYAPLDGSFVKTADILLLVRPDYTIFDEIRKTKDFEIFSDMRLAGIGMIGVVHSTDAISSVQRFIGRTELGMIPHIVDTIIFVKDGEIKKVYSLSLTVRVPHGMCEADLARPIVDVNDFETGKLEYEIYTYGEQTVVMPIKEEKKSAVEKLALEKIKTEISKFDHNAKIEFVNANRISVRVRNDAIPYIIGKEGKTIKNLEDRLGISIDIEPVVESLGNEIDHHISDTGGYVILEFTNATGKNINIYIDNEYLFTATVGRSDQIRVNKKSDLGRQIIKALTRKSTIKTFV
ncbi:MAG: PINc/VapC family ATPase [Nanoarchaeota archaeon]|nr:PINc/VapC family ATPase [Nanoarchaeota archaeon]